MSRVVTMGQVGDTEHIEKALHESANAVPLRARVRKTRAKKKTLNAATLSDDEWGGGGMRPCRP